MKLYLASGNAHKAAEMNALAQASDLAVEIVSAKTVGGMPPVAEDTGTFIGNAQKKALALQAVLPAGSWVLADDSGVCVEALDGGPGVESAYFAGPQGDPRANLLKLVEVMRGVPATRRGAYFYCLLVLLGPAGEREQFEGRCDGVLLDELRGEGGFGYDPIFRPDGYERSYAELTEEEKNRISHRGLAWSKLAEWLRKRLTSQTMP
jgi:XTP/dITP diphosphohydrolase